MEVCDTSVDDLKDYADFSFLTASTTCLNPSPEHSGQAPHGVLNEKRRGSISSIEIPQSPVFRGKKGEFVKELASYKKSGYGRVKIDGIIYDFRLFLLRLPAGFLTCRDRLNPRQLPV